MTFKRIRIRKIRENDTFKYQNRSSFCKRKIREINETND